MKRRHAIIACAFALALACDDRFAFDTGSVMENAAGAAEPPEGGASPELGTGGRAGSGGDARGGTLAEECGGTRGLVTAGNAGAPGETAELPSDLDCTGPNAGCTRCRTHAECGYERLCDPVLLVCVQCRRDADCPPQFACSTVTHRCE